MRDRRNTLRDQTGTGLFALLLAAVALLGSSAEAARPGKRNSSGSSAPPPLSQKDTQVLSYQANDRGSDDSLKNSTVYAMQALMDLSQLKLANAMKNGFNAYGKYRNAENLDRLKDHNALMANSLASVGNGPNIAVPARTNTSFRRLDANFLRDGEAGKVASEFERMTGMTRGDFLTQMADISEKKIKRSDPMMIDKALTRFEGFLQKIPNSEFRRNAEKGIAMVPNTVRRGIVGQAVTKLAGFFADAGSHTPAPVELVASDAQPAAASAQPLPGTAAAGSSSELAANDKATGELAGSHDASRQPSDIALPLQPTAVAKKAGADKNGYNGAIVAALRVQTQDSVTGLVASDAGGTVEATIFQQVHSRYQSLSAGLAIP